MQPQTIYVSATPAPREIGWAQGKVVELVVRPTGLIDPKVTIKPLKGQIDDLLEEVRKRTELKARVGHDTDEAHGGGAHRLPARHRGERALSAQRN